MCAKAIGWLFGLAAQETVKVSAEGICIRRMTEEEMHRILGTSQDFFAKDVVIWQNTIARFPLVYEKDVDESYPVGGEEGVGILLNLLSPGEVRVPVQWVLRTNSSGMASCSTVIEHFFRFINNRFQEARLENIRAAATVALQRLPSELLTAPTALGLDPVLIERMYATKRYPLQPQSPVANTIARAAEICMGLEYLMNENAMSEILFRLSLSLAWLLETDPAGRENTLKNVRQTYDLRSKTVHGGRLSSKDLKKVCDGPVIQTDRIFRRAILTRLMFNANDSSWIEMIRQARLGFDLRLDRADWVPE